MYTRTRFFNTVLALVGLFLAGCCFNDALHETEASPRILRTLKPAEEDGGLTTVTVFLLNSSRVSSESGVLIEIFDSTKTKPAKGQTAFLPLLSENEENTPQQIAWAQKIPSIPSGKGYQLEYQMNGPPSSRGAYFIPDSKWPQFFAKRIDDSNTKIQDVTVSPETIESLLAFYANHQRAHRRNYAVIPMGWLLRFTEDDHHIRNHGMEFTKDPFYDEDAGTLYWETRATLQDNSENDDIEWRPDYAVLRLRDTLFIYFSASSFFHKRTYFKETVRITHEELSRFSSKAAVLTGWSISIRDENQECGEFAVGVKMGPPSPDPNQVEVEVELDFNDFGHTLFTGETTVEVQGLIIATNAGEFDPDISRLQHLSYSGGGSGSPAPVELDRISSLSGYENVIALPKKWSFHWLPRGETHHLRRHKARILNQRGEDGYPRFDFQCNYADKNGDDGYQYDAEFVVLGFNDADGALRYIPELELYDDSNGVDTREFFVRIADLFP